MSTNKREIATGIKVTDLREGQLKEVAAGDRKVLLSRLRGGVVAATSHLCPHYKAPLVNGTLSVDGRLMCPWHGACFRVQTGDIEDAPSADALVSYPVRIDADGHVHVTVNDDDLRRAMRPAPLCKHDAKKDMRVALIVGGGAAGWGAAEGLRKHGFAGRIVVVSKESCLPVDRPKLSKGLNITLDKTLLRPAAFYMDAGIEFLLGVEATKIDVNDKSVTLSNGLAIGYWRVLIATGGNPRNFWVSQTAALTNVLQMRTLDDATMLTTAMAAKKQPNIAIIGSSFIGMEAAAVLAKLGSVTVIGMEKVPFERVLGEQVGMAFQKFHESNKVSFKMQTTVESFEADAGNTQCVALRLKDGSRLMTDLVILGAGVAPATEWLKGSAVKVNGDGSIDVDGNMRVVGMKDVFAAGDLAKYPFHLSDKGHKIRVEHWDTAIQQGIVAAQNMLNDAANVIYRTIPFFWTNQLGKALRYCGHATDYDDVIIQGDLKGMKFVAYYVKGERVLAVASVASDPVVSKASELMRVDAMPSASQLRSGNISLLDITTPAADAVSPSL